MPRKLATHVTVHERDDKGELTGRTGTFGPDDDRPDWAEKAITNPDVWVDDAPDGADQDSPPAPASGPPIPDPAPAKGVSARDGAEDTGPSTGDANPAGADEGAPAPKSTRPRSAR